MKKRIIALFIAFVFVSLIGVVHAKKSKKMKKDVKASIAEKMDLSVEQVNNLKEKKFGYGEILLLSEFAKKTGKSVENIVADRDSGMGWGDIAKKYDVKLGEIKSGAKKSLKSMKGDFKNKKQYKKAKKQLKKIEAEDTKMKAEKEMKEEAEGLKNTEKEKKMMKEENSKMKEKGKKKSK